MLGQTPNPSFWREASQTTGLHILMEPESTKGGAHFCTTILKPTFPALGATIGGLITCRSWIFFVEIALFWSALEKMAFSPIFYKFGARYRPWVAWTATVPPRGLVRSTLGWRCLVCPSLGQICHKLPPRLLVWPSLGQIRPMAATRTEALGLTWSPVLGFEVACVEEKNGERTMRRRW